ncbi:MAG: hypothetical protein IH934_01085 [Nanoarchaeota archaeon]|nr:hypothetical protein [Nanoarchaeota archaeon]
MPNSFSIYEELVYSGTVEDGDIIEIADSLFEFRIVSGSNKVYIEIDISGIIIESGGCEIKGNFDICISNISFSYRNLTGYYDVYKTNVKVYQIKSKLDIKNTIKQNNILLNEETTAELSIENTADIVAEDVTATIDVPSSILVTDVEGCKKIFDTIVFQEDIHPKQIKKCTYKIQGLSPDDFELTASIFFFDGIEQINTTSSTISAKVYNYSLKITPKLDKSKFDIGEELDLTINLKNINDQYDLTVTALKIKLPGKLLLIKKPKDATINNKIITWSGTLAPEENKDLAIKLQGQRTGNYSVLTEASYKIEKFLRKAEESANIEVYCDCPYIIHDFSQQIAVPEQRVRLSAFLINPSRVHRFRNVKINYFTNIPNIQDHSTAYSEIKPLETIKIFDSSIITPPLNEIYHLNLESAYESSNQVFIVRDNIIIEVPKIEEKPEEEQETIEEIEEQQEAKEEIEEQQQEVSLETEITRAIDETEKKETEEDISVTEIKLEEEKPIKAFVIIAYIAAIIFVLVILIIFKREKGGDIDKQEYIKKIESKVDIIDRERHNIKDFLSMIFRKKESSERKTTHKRKEEQGYEDLERQVRELGNIFEKEKQLEKKGLFGRIFRKK